MNVYRNKCIASIVAAPQQSIYTYHFFSSPITTCLLSSHQIPSTADRLCTHIYTN